MTIEIVGVDRKEEVGDMAAAVKRFKHGLIEADRPAAEDEIKLRRAEAIDEWVASSTLI